MNMKKLSPWNWFRKEEETRAYPVSRLHSELDRMFDSFFGGSPLWSEGRGVGGVMIRPSLDIAESDKEYTISVEVPGVEEKDIELTLEDDCLVVKGEKKHEQETKDKDYHRVERAYGSFQRVLTLPHNADKDKLSASFKNGVLTITVPKLATIKSQGRTISIEKK